MSTPLNPYDRKHKLHLRKLEKQVDKIYDEAINQAVQIGVALNGFNRSKPFSFKSKAITDKKAEQLVMWLKQGLEQTITLGITDSWDLSNAKNDAAVASIYGKADVLPDIIKRRYYNKNGEAEQAFIARKRGGLGLSDNVWRYSNQFRQEVELGLDLGIRSGRSASQISRDIRIYLQNPDKLFRRIRQLKTDDGEPVYKLSKRAAIFHPGQGVYRSSYKNALRLAVTETNMAYRTADHLRWQQFDFVRGIHIQTSDTNHPVADICDELQGDYPKDFKFTGWHPFCRCFATPIMVSEDEMTAHKDAFLRGESYDFKQKQVKEMPVQFREWEKKNAKRITDASKRGTLPYFIKDNAKYMSKGILPKETTPLTTLEKAKLRHEARTPEQIADIKARAEERQNRMALENALGIKQGKPMTFEEANAMRGNPHYAEDVQYRINCQSAVVANEMRRRGFDVEAFGNTKLTNTCPYLLSSRTEAAWIDANGNVPTPTKIYREVKSKTIDRRGAVRKTYETDKEILAKIHEATKEEGRYHVSWQWSKGETAHIVTCERMKDGTIRWYDPQSGKIAAPSLKSIDVTKHSMNVLRVDTLRPNVDIVRGVVKPVGSLLQTPTADNVQKEFWRKNGNNSTALKLTDASPLTEYKNSVRTDNNLLPIKEHLRTENMLSGDLRMKGTARKNLINHCKDEEAVRAAIHTWKHPEELRHERRSELAENKDMNNPRDRKNIQEKIDRGVEYYNLYEIEHGGSKWRVFVEVLKNGQEQLHSIYKKNS